MPCPAGRRCLKQAGGMCEGMLRVLGASGMHEGRWMCHVPAAFVMGAACVGCWRHARGVCRGGSARAAGGGGGAGHAGGRHAPGAQAAGARQPPGRPERRGHGRLDAHHEDARVPAGPQGARGCCPWPPVAANMPSTAGPVLQPVQTRVWLPTCALQGLLAFLLAIEEQVAQCCGRSDQGLCRELAAGVLLNACWADRGSAMPQCCSCSDQA
jgi:hypothetical protein